MSYSSHSEYNFLEAVATRRLEKAVYNRESTLCIWLDLTKQMPIARLLNELFCLNIEHECFADARKCVRFFMQRSPAMYAFREAHFQLYNTEATEGDDKYFLPRLKYNELIQCVLAWAHTVG